MELVESDRIRVSVQRELIYTRWIVRAYYRVPFAATKLVSLVVLPDELIMDATDAVGWRGAMELVRRARSAVRAAIANPSTGPVEHLHQGEPCELHSIDEFPALRQFVDELLLSGRQRAVQTSQRTSKTESRNLSRCPPSSGDTDAPSVITLITEVSPSVTDSVTSTSTSTSTASTDSADSGPTGMLP